MHESDELPHFWHECVMDCILTFKHLFVFRSTMTLSHLCTLDICDGWVDLYQGLWRRKGNWSQCWKKLVPFERIGPSPDLAGFNERLSKMLSNWLWRKSDFIIFKPLADFRSLDRCDMFSSGQACVDGGNQEGFVISKQHWHVASYFDMF